MIKGLQARKRYVREIVRWGFEKYPYACHYKATILRFLVAVAPRNDNIRSLHIY